MSTAVRMEHIREASPRLMSRIAGVFYLLNILTILFAVFCFRRLIVSGDAATTAANISAHETLLRSAFASELISTACSIAVAALFYRLLKPVNSSLSLLAAVFRLAACAVAALSYVFHLAPLFLLGGAHYLNVFKMEQLQALAFLFFKLQGQASVVVVVFFAFHGLLIGYLIFGSAFVPRILGVLFGLAGLAGLTFLIPPLVNHAYLYLVATGLLAETSLTLWLLVIGVNEQRWKEQAGAAG